MKDNCGRRIIKVYPPNTTLAPNDSIVFSDSVNLNYFGEIFGRDFNWKNEDSRSIDLSRKSGILPCCLTEGSYRAGVDYEHFMFDKDESPIKKKININTNFEIIPFNNNTKKEYIDFLTFCNYLFSGQDKPNVWIKRCNEFIEKNPNNLYNKSLTKFINYYTKKQCNL